MTHPRSPESVPAVSVLLPTYNEAENIVPLIDALRPLLPEASEIVVMDDNSPDGTADLVRAHSQTLNDPRIRVIQRLHHRGLTNSLREGIQSTHGKVVVWMDCDFSMPPEVIPVLLSNLDEGFHAVVGSRFVRGGSFKQHTEGTPDSALAVFLSRAMNVAIQLFLDHSFKDYTSGFIAIRREVLDDVPLRGDYGEYFIDLIFRALRKGYRVLEVPYTCIPRQRGVSKTGQTLAQYLTLGTGYVLTALSLRLGALTHRAQPKREAASVPVSAQQPIIIRPLDPSQLPNVAALHVKVLSQTLNSRLGVPFLMNLYGALLEDPLVKVWVALSGTRVVGFVSATTDLLTTDRRLLKNVSWRDRFFAAIHVLTRFSFFRDYLAHSALLQFAKSAAQPYATILTLGVSDSVQSRRIGSTLVKQVVDDFSMQGVAALHVDTMESNRPAEAFYEKKCTFQKVGKAGPNVIFEYVFRQREGKEI